jgi:hypothetical protein
MVNFERRHPLPGLPPGSRGGPARLGDLRGAWAAPGFRGTVRLERCGGGLRRIRRPHDRPPVRRHRPQQGPARRPRPPAVALSLRHCPRRRSSATLRSTGALPGGRRPAITSPPPAAGRASGPIRPSAWPLPPPRNWGESQAELACEANLLMHELGCPLYGQPELMGAAVRLEALGSPSR